MYANMALFAETVLEIAPGKASSLEDLFTGLFDCITRALCMFIRLFWYATRDLYAEIVRKFAFSREICALDCTPLWSLNSTLYHSARSDRAFWKV